MQFGEDWQREQFIRAGREPASWILIAADLLLAANTLEKVHNDRRKNWEANLPVTLASVQGPYMMMLGYCLESVMKAIMIARDQSRITDSAKLRKWDGNPHDLVRLAKDVGLTLSNEEAELLGRLTQYTLWAGRYPIPNTPSTDVPYWSSHDKETFTAVLKRVLDLASELFPGIDKLIDATVV